MMKAIKFIIDNIKKEETLMSIRKFMIKILISLFMFTLVFGLAYIGLTYIAFVLLYSAHYLVCFYLED